MGTKSGMSFASITMPFVSLEMALIYELEISISPLIAIIVSNIALSPCIDDIFIPLHEISQPKSPATSQNDT